jgi:GPH family glycoside/pentoside/hexuronide:cation symporter
MQAEQPRLVASLQAAFKNRPFIFGAVIFLLTWVAVDILQTSLLFFIKYVLLREDQSDLIMGAIFVTAIIALPLWVWMASHWNKRLAYIFGISFWAAVQVVMVTLGAESSLPWILTLCIMAGIGVSAAHVLTWAIIPDAIEWDELHTGKRHEGMFYSLISLMQKVASSIAIPLILLLLDRTGYIPNAAVQEPSALFGIRLVVGPIPALLLLGGIAFAYLYPLGRVEYNRLVERLEERRAAAALEPPEAS